MSDRNTEKIVALSVKPRVDYEMLHIHAEDAAFVLSQRALVCEAPNYRLVDLYDLEQRLVGHLEALIVAKEAGGEVAFDLARTNADQDSVAVLLHVALRLGREDLIEQALCFAPQEDGCCDFWRRLAEAASWCPTEVLSKVLGRWISGGHPLLRWIALEICGIHRIDPRHHFVPALHDPDRRVRQRAARLSGELGRTDAVGAVLSIGGDEADLAAVLLGVAEKARRLADIVAFPRDARMARRFAEVLPLALPDHEAKTAIRELLSNQETRRWGVVAIGTLGWSGGLASLQKLMADPLCARVAVSAVEQITGIYFAHEELELDDFPEDPKDLRLDGVEHFAETNTPWPDPAKFRAWLDGNMAKYSDKARLLLGVPAWTLNGPPEPWVKYQARNRWIAITQAMRRPEAPLPNWASRVRLEGTSFGRRW
jgi:uncharacterized protein (TIGR02270 family)